MPWIGHGYSGLSLEGRYPSMADDDPQMVAMLAARAEGDFITSTASYRLIKWKLSEIPALAASMEVLDNMDKGQDGSNERHAFEELISAQQALAKLKSDALADPAAVEDMTIDLWNKLSVCGIDPPEALTKFWAARRVTQLKDGQKRYPRGANLVPDGRKVASFAATEWTPGLTKGLVKSVFHKNTSVAIQKGFGPGEELKQLDTSKVLITVDGADKLVAASAVKAKLLPETELLQPTEQGESHSVYRSQDTLVIKSLSKAQRTKMRMTIPVSRGLASNPTKNKYLSFLEEQDIIQPQHATQIQQVLDVNDRDVKEVRQQVLVGTWLGNAALRALAASGPGGAAMGAEERKQMEEMTYTAMMLQQDLLVKIGERTAKTLQEQLGLPSMTQLKGHIATTGELSNDMKAQMAHTLTDSLKLKKAAAEALDLNFFPRRADAPTGEHSVTTTTKPARATLQQLVKNGARRKDTTAHTATIADTSLSSLRPRRKTGTREQDEARGREIGAGDEPALRIVDNRIVDEGGATTSKSTSGGRAAAEHQTRVRSIKAFAQPFEGGIQVYFILAGFEMDATESEDMDGVDGANEGGGESHAAANDGPSAVRPQTRGDAGSPGVASVVLLLTRRCTRGTIRANRSN